ncbi:SMP-30/gluconolactonase/LRE family protein [Streptosporangium fragile]|uniref:SMP-30/gluconolactonase/LRE family protein n=1 Tax=Streptosporangium fragile TaxID=46186 RepID=A0ABN3W3Y0_9ACTN
MVSSFEAEPVLRIRADLGEGPAWDAARERLVWVDITAGAVHLLDPATGVDRAVDVGIHVGAAVPTADGELLLAVRDGIARLSAEGTVRMVAEVEADVPGNRMNDAKCDPAGRLWAGTMPYEATPGAGALYRYDGASVVKIRDGVSVSNGLGWSPDGTVMYHIDTRAQRVDAYAYDAATGDIRDRRTAVGIDPADGSPDGMTVDDDGCLWVALWGGSRVRRYTPGGVLDREVRLPVTQVTSCAFGGPRGDVLYITSAAHGLDPAALAGQPLAGSVFAVEPGVTGRPAVPFSGDR